MRLFPRGPQRAMSTINADVDAAVRSLFSVKDYFVAEEGAAEYSVAYDAKSGESFLRLLDRLKSTEYSAQLYGDPERATLVVVKNPPPPAPQLKVRLSGPAFLFLLTLLSLLVTGYVVASIFPQPLPGELLPGDGGGLRGRAGRGLRGEVPRAEVRGEEGELLLPHLLPAERPPLHHAPDALLPPHLRLGELPGLPSCEQEQALRLLPRRRGRDARGRPGRLPPRRGHVRHPDARPGAGTLEREPDDHHPDQPEHPPGRGDLARAEPGGPGPGPGGRDARLLPRRDRGVARPPARVLQLHARGASSTEGGWPASPSGSARAARRRPSLASSSWPSTSRTTGWSSSSSS